jgi:hypothetical protein
MFMGLFNLFVVTEPMAEDKEVRHCLQSASRFKGQRLFSALKLIYFGKGAITKNKPESKRSNL